MRVSRVSEGSRLVAQAPKSHGGRMAMLISPRIWRVRRRMNKEATVMTKGMRDGDEVRPPEGREPDRQARGAWPTSTAAPIYLSNKRVAEFLGSFHAE